MGVYYIYFVAYNLKVSYCEIAYNDDLQTIFQP
jgi:hypothetical protein